MATGYVGSTIVDSPIATITITAADLPAGTVAGDLIFITPFWIGDDVVSDFSTATPGWTKDHVKAAREFVPGFNWLMGSYSGRYKISTLPMTIALSGTVASYDGTGFWAPVYYPRAVVTTVHPARTIGTVEIGVSTRTDDRGPRAFPALDEAYDGLVIAGLLSNVIFGTTSALTTIETGVSVGWTEVEDISWTNFGGNFKVAVADAGRSPGYMPRWLKLASSATAPIVAHGWELRDPLPYGSGLGFGLTLGPRGPGFHLA